MSIPKRKTRAEQARDIRARLLAAARTVFLREGYHGASLDEVVRIAGLTKGAVYSRFASKAELFLALLEQRVEMRNAELPAAERAGARGVDAMFRQWLDRTRGDEAWALPVFCLAEFIRVVSHPRVFDPPTPAEDALAAVDALLESPSCRLLVPEGRYWVLLRQAVRDSAASGNLVFDAQIVAVCLEHGARTILTEDRDFSRFPGLTVRGLPR